MTAVGLGQQGSQVVGSGFESLSCQTFYDLSLTVFDTRISETLKSSFRKFFGTVRQKILNGKSWYSPPLLSKLFRYPKVMQQ